MLGFVLRHHDALPPHTQVGHTHIQHLHSNETKCFAGFARDETGACRRLVVPANATVRNNRWTCNPGFVRSEDDACKKI